MIRVNVDSVAGLMGVLSARAKTLGASTRAERATLYGLSSSALADLENGDRAPTAEERDALFEAFAGLGVSYYPGHLAALPAAEPAP